MTNKDHSWYANTAKSSFLTLTLTNPLPTTLAASKSLQSHTMTSIHHGMSSSTQSYHSQLVTLFSVLAFP